jgi:hypothetical protein
MAVSVQGWRKKWFYIKDRKVSSSDQYGIAPFDASKEVKKLASWDSLLWKLRWRKSNHF